MLTWIDIAYSTMRTIMSHFYNEAYLLPWWLEHHKKYFDHGILIDYGSTDNSIEIIRDICPTWEIFGSRYQRFDSSHLEYEMMYYDRQVYGWRICIPVTEFLVGDIIGMTNDNPERQQWIVPTLVLAEYNPFATLDRSKKLWEQITTGHYYTNTASPNAWQCRSLHNFNDIFYMPGRHFSNENTDKLMIFKYSNVLVGEEMIKRKLQIQTKISDRDKDKAAGQLRAVTHCSLDDDELTVDNLYDNYIRLIGQTEDVTKQMNSVLKYL